MKNPKYLLPENIIYEEIARETHEMRQRGLTWRDIAYEYAARYSDLGLTIGQWSNLLHNTYYRAGYSSTPTPRIKAEESKALTDIEKVRIAEIKEQGRYTNLVPKQFDSDFVAGTSHIRIGIVSDTHFGAKVSQYTHLREFYETCAEAGITDIYHAGDIDDGSDRMHAGILYERHIHGATEHIENIVTHYPHVDGITTHYITGNHDNSFLKDTGLQIGEEISMRRPDMHYLGRDIAHVQLTPNCKMELRHPGDGSAYSLSYKPQKMIEAYTSDADKPDILVIGHYHKAMYMCERGINALLAGSFCGQTPFLLSKNIASVVAGWVLDIDLDRDGRIVAFKPTLIRYEEIKDDWKNL